MKEPPGESELTGATNLMAYYGLEHSYSKFSGKKLIEAIGNFLFVLILFRICGNVTLTGRTIFVNDLTDDKKQHIDEKISSCIPVETKNDPKAFDRPMKNKNTDNDKDDTDRTNDKNKKMKKHGQGYGKSVEKINNKNSSKKSLSF
ncbi:hypothetical protein HCN44_003984 [Aphidius gifuensis]|uniref:Mediator of RNA polymerase II transcription subunit 19 n=1 Tax=Aphidius gifuensis TaxID=684658 RepID=A0A834XXW1_APHGI|nr:hypothetical protein HCN44_003984 [Aphidius gifuensis]